MSNFTFSLDVFYAICVLKSFNTHISAVICSFFEFGTVSKWCIREWVNESIVTLPLSVDIWEPVLGGTE